ncbi:hypothetical protein HKD37_10G028262 [Glycine soja]
MADERSRIGSILNSHPCKLDDSLAIIWKAKDFVDSKHVTRSLTVAQGFLSPAWPLFVATVDVTQGSLVSVLARSSHTSYVAELDLFWDLNPGQASPTTTTTTMGYFDLNIPYPEPSLANKATEQGNYISTPLLG